MNASAGKREFSIFSLFLHDNEAADARPFSQWELAKALNAKAIDLYPHRLVEFVCPDDSGNSAWYVRFNANRYTVNGRGEQVFDVFPGVTRCYDERTFRRIIPVELDEVLLELDKADIVL